MVLRGTDVIDLSTANAKSIKHNMMVQLVSEKNLLHWSLGKFVMCHVIIMFCLHVCALQTGEGK